MYLPFYPPIHLSLSLSLSDSQPLWSEHNFFMSELRCCCFVVVSSFLFLKVVACCKQDGNGVPYTLALGLLTALWVLLCYFISFFFLEANSLQTNVRDIQLGLRMYKCSSTASGSFRCWSEAEINVSCIFCLDVPWSLRKCDKQRTERLEEKKKRSTHL